MYTNDFLGMDFTEDGRGVVFHYLTGQFIAEEYEFEKTESATHFYFCCLRFFDAVQGCTSAKKEKMFREFLDTDFLEMNYSKKVYGSWQ